MVDLYILDTDCVFTFIKSMQSQPNTSAKSFLLHLKTIGTWSGIDFEECLEVVQNSKGQAQFNYDSNPFD